MQRMSTISQAQILMGPNKLVAAEPQILMVYILTSGSALFVVVYSSINSSSIVRVVPSR